MELGRAQPQSNCRHPQVQKYACGVRSRRWCCSICGRPVSEEWARKVVRRKLRGARREVERV